jgi:ligand-binding SRPBCC domain-containing protein
MDHELHTRLELPLPVDEVFPFFAEAGNLERITPPELRFVVLTPPGVTIHRGTLLEYRLRLFGVPFGWITRIAAWDPPHGFVPTPRGTLIDDQVRYRLPLGPAGELAHPLVSRQLARIFAYRQRAVAAELLGVAPPPQA